MSEYMIFCLGDGRTELKGEGYQKNHRIFNKDVSENEYKKVIDSIDIEIKLTEWITQDGVYLKVYNYEEAWKNWLKESTQEQRQSILNIPQFNEDIFKEITGLTKADLEKDLVSNKKKKKLISKAEELKKKADELLVEANKL